MLISLVARNVVSGKWFLIQGLSPPLLEGNWSLHTTLPHWTLLDDSVKLLLLLGKFFNPRTVTATVFQFLKGTKIHNSKNQNFCPSCRKFYHSFKDKEFYSKSAMKLVRRKTTFYTLDLKHRTFQIKNSSLFHCLPDLGGRWKSTGTWFDAWKGRILQQQVCTHTHFRSNNSSATILSLVEKAKAWDRPMLASTLILSTMTIQAHPSETEGGKIKNKLKNYF